MPELPDLEVFSHNLNKKLAKKELKEVTVVNKSKLNVTVTQLKKALEGAILKKVYREGKELHFAFANDAVLALHLMLHGGLGYYTDKNIPKNTIIELAFENTGLALSDYQGAATPTLNPEEKTAPDALSKEVNFDFLKEKLSKKRTNIKTFLLDQKNIRGIGNAYADEILWEAGISPFSVCNKIPDPKIKALDKSIKAVLEEAIEQIKKIKPDIISGEVRSFLKIHNSKKKESPTGGKILTTTINSRITYYTEEQELFE